MEKNSPNQALEQALAALTDPLRHKRLLDWMERLDACADARAAQPILDEIMTTYAAADRQHLRGQRPMMRPGAGLRDAARRTAPRPPPTETYPARIVDHAAARARALAAFQTIKRRA